MANLGHVQVVTGIALLLFAALMIGIGIFSTKRASSMEGFLLGGRKIGPWLTAFSYGTSYFSAVIFIGYAGQNKQIPEFFGGIRSRRSRIRSLF